MGHAGIAFADPAELAIPSFPEITGIEDSSFPRNQT